ncbi:MAG: histidine phosphatase family protein [Ruminococcaceae bacterium]|nr:histidine phosphatase family protein [Oscillospiraceae bacterium]
MTTLILLRHGFSTYNKERRYSGQHDVPLEPSGYRQAEDAAWYLTSHYTIDCIWSSDLSRAVNTARPTADALGLEIHTTPELREVDLGNWTNRLIDEVKQEQPERFARMSSGDGYARFGNGENYAELAGRTELALRRIARANNGKTVLVSAHNGTIRSLLIGWTGASMTDTRNAPSLPNASITVVEFEDGHFKLKLVGFDGHLCDHASETRAE